MAFSVERRAEVRDRVLALARVDERVTGGAITGSASVAAEDRWSDIDLTFGITDDIDPKTVLDDWTAALAHDLEILHSWDLPHGSTVYRVFLLPGGLELDVSVTPAGDFGSRGGKFKLLFGDRVAARPQPGPDLDELVGYGWLYALTARTAIVRNRPWAAEHWISELRHQSLALASLHAGLPTEHARGLHRLPSETVERYEPALVHSIDVAELRRALSVNIALYLDEVARVDGALAGRLREPLEEAVADSI